MSLGKESPYIFSKFNPLNTDTSLLRTVCCVPGERKSLYFQELNSKKLLSKFRKRKRKSLSFVHVLHKTWNWEVSRQSRTTIDGKGMNKVVVLLIKVIAFLPFSLPSPSSLLKLPNVSSRPLKKVLWKLRSPRGHFRKFSLSAGVQNSGNVFQSNVSFLFYSYRGFGSLPRSRFFGCHAPWGSVAWHPKNGCEGD